MQIFFEGLNSYLCIDVPSLMHEYCMNSVLKGLFQVLALLIACVTQRNTWNGKT